MLRRSVEVTSRGNSPIGRRYAPPSGDCYAGQSRLLVEVIAPAGVATRRPWGSATQVNRRHIWVRLRRRRSNSLLLPCFSISAPLRVAPLKRAVARAARGIFRGAVRPLLLVAVPSPLRGAAPGARGGSCDHAPAPAALAVAGLGGVSLGLGFFVPFFSLCRWAAGASAKELGDVSLGVLSPFGLAAAAAQVCLVDLMSHLGLGWVIATQVSRGY